MTGPFDLRLTLEGLVTLGDGKRGLDITHGDAVEENSSGSTPRHQTQVSNTGLKP